MKPPPSQSARFDLLLKELTCNLLFSTLKKGNQTPEKGHLGSGNIILLELFADCDKLRQAFDNTVVFVLDNMKVHVQHMHAYAVSCFPFSVQPAYETNGSLAAVGQCPPLVPNHHLTAMKNKPIPFHFFWVG